MQDTKKRSGRKHAMSRPLYGIVVLGVVAPALAVAEPAQAPGPVAIESAAMAQDPAEPAAAPAEELVSLATVAPGVYSWFNDGAVFGLAGTQVGPLGERTHLTNDWGGMRTRWARNGVFINLYNTTAYQNVSGGVNSGDAGISNTQLSFDLDTGRLGWWNAGLIHASFEARYGSENVDVYGAGTLVPTYYGAVLPQPDKDSDVLWTNLFIEQAFGKFGLIVGVIPGLYVPDRTLFGDDWKRYFSNYSFNENPIFTQFYNPQTTTVTASYAPNEAWALSLGVYDANTDTTDISKDFFSEINVYGQATYTYGKTGLPGQVLFGSLWSNQEKLNLRDPVSITTTDTTTYESVNTKDESWFVIANFSQYLSVREDPDKRAALLAAGEPLRGVGVFGRLGYSPEDTSAITQHYSLALFAHGVSDARPDDTFGAGYHFSKISGDLKDGLRSFSNGDLSIRDESGFEVFYDLAITPAISLNVSYQHIFNPFQASLEGDEDDADIFMVRLNTTW